MNMTKGTVHSGLTFLGWSGSHTHCLSLVALVIGSHQRPKSKKCNPTLCPAGGAEERDMKYLAKGVTIFPGSGDASVLVVLAMFSGLSRFQ